MRDIYKGIGLFNESDFFSAHHFFEDCWINCDRQEKLFFQGLVQISVGCYHLLNGNYNGSISQLTKGQLKLNCFIPFYHDINILKLVEEIESLIKLLCGDNLNDREEIWNAIPKIEINC